MNSTFFCCSCTDCCSLLIWFRIYSEDRNTSHSEMFLQQNQPASCKYVPILLGCEGGLPTFLGKSPLAFFHTHFKHVYLTFKVLPSTIIKQSKHKCFAATLSISSSVCVSCGNSHTLTSLWKMQHSLSCMQTSNWLKPQAAAWMACVQSVQSGQLVL